MADAIWRRFHYRRLSAQDPDADPPYGELLDLLQADVFLPACARRALAEREVTLDPDEIHDRLRLVRVRGPALAGLGARFHNHAFDLGEPYEEGIENHLMSGDGTVHARPEVRLVLLTGDDADLD